MAKNAVKMIVHFELEGCDAEWVKHFAKADILKALQKLGLVISEQELEVKIPINQADILARV